MSINKIEMGVIERIAPSRGPTSSSDYNSSMEEVRNALASLTLEWNQNLQPLLDSLPGGLTGIDIERRTSRPNPFKNGLDGSQLYTDMTSTPIVDEGRYYSETRKRPYTIKETFSSIQSQVNDKIQVLEVEMAKFGNTAAITARQKQSIGMRIFDPTTESNASSLDGQAQSSSKSIDQLALDISGNPNYLQGNGAMTLLHSIFDQVSAIQKAHDYNKNFNRMSHQHLQFHDHRYHQKPVGVLNGANRNFSLPGDETFVQGSLRVIVNSLELERNVHYVERADRKGFTMSEEGGTPIDATSGLEPLEADSAGSDDKIWIHYDVDTSGQ